MFWRDHREEGLAERIDQVMLAVFVADPDDRTAQLAGELSPDFVYVSPDGVFDGVDGLSEAFGGYRHEAWRRTSLRRTSSVDLHHGYFRFTWARLERDATAMEGWAFGSLDDQGAVRRVVVFEGLEPDGGAGRE